jgi:hypothetical protein
LGFLFYPQHKVGGEERAHDASDADTYLKIWGTNVPSAPIGKLNGLFAGASIKRHSVSHHEVPRTVGWIVAADMNASSEPPMPLVALLNQNSINTRDGYEDPCLVVGIQPIYTNVRDAIRDLRTILSTTSKDVGDFTAEFASMSDNCQTLKSSSLVFGGSRTTSSTRCTQLRSIS